MFQSGIEASQIVPAGVTLLTGITGWWDARDYGGTGALINKGTGGSSLNLTLNGTPALGTGTIIMDGVNDYLSVADDSNLDLAGADDFHMGVIMTQTVGGNYGTLMTKYSGSGAGYIFFENGAAVQITAQVSNGTTTVTANTPAGSLSTKTILSAKRTGGFLTGYKDAVAGTAVAEGTGLNMTNAIALQIGASVGGTFFYAFTFHGAFFARRALSTTELGYIKSLYGIA